MTCYIYKNSAAVVCNKENEALQQYIELNALKDVNGIVDPNSTKINWNKRSIARLIAKAKKGDCIVAFNGTSLACSVSQIIEILKAAAKANINLHFVKHSIQLDNQTSQINTQTVLRLLGLIESDFISERTTQALAKRKAAGLALGRPVGSRNKNTKH